MQRCLVCSQIEFRVEENLKCLLIPVDNVVNEMLLEHETPSFDDVEKSLLERFRINTEPPIDHCNRFDRFHFGVDCLIVVNLAIHTYTLIYANVVTSILSLGQGLIK